MSRRSLSSKLTRGLLGGVPRHVAFLHSALVLGASAENFKACKREPNMALVSGACGTFSMIDYFGTPTNRAPVNLPSAPTRGA